VNREKRDSFIQPQRYVSVSRINRTFRKAHPWLAKSFHVNINAGGRRFAFCFRKAFDSVGDHYASRVQTSSTSFHRVNVGQCFPSGVQGRHQPKILLRRLRPESSIFDSRKIKRKKGYEIPFIHKYWILSFI